jgi:hypothetical protein
MLTLAFIGAFVAGAASTVAGLSLLTWWMANGGYQSVDD